ELRKEAKEADARLTQLAEVELPAAEEADRDAFAARLAKNPAQATDPGDRHSDKVRVRIDRERRRYNALDIAVRKLEDETGDLIVQSRDGIVAASRKRAEE